MCGAECHTTDTFLGAGLAFDALFCGGSPAKVGGNAAIHGKCFALPQGERRLFGVSVKAKLKLLNARMMLP
eukprot:458903-Amphidinium_carterae.2